jgi:hypothetical protein
MCVTAHNLHCVVLYSKNQDQEKCSSEKAEPRNFFVINTSNEFRFYQILY